MRISAFLVTTVIIGGVAGSALQGQTTSESSPSVPTIKTQTGNTPTRSTATMGSQTRTGKASALGKSPEIPGLSHQSKASARKSSRKLPPPPPMVGNGISTKRTAKKAISPEEMFLNDPSGRVDLSGKPVRHYPSPRSLAAARSQAPAVKQHAAKVRENPQYKKEAAPQ